jgi:hypothetical protein
MTDIKEIIEAAHSPKKGGHSALYWYFWKNHDRLAESLNRNGVHWESVADKMKGHVDGKGQPPNQRVTRHTWRMVDRDKTDGPKKRKVRVDRTPVNRAFRISSARKGQ